MGKDTRTFARGIGEKGERAAGRERFRDSDMVIDNLDFLFSFTTAFVCFKGQCIYGKSGITPPCYTAILNLKSILMKSLQIKASCPLNKFICL